MSEKVLEPDGFCINEAKSNPLVMAMEHESCPIGEICLLLTVGFGALVGQCNHLEHRGESPICNCQCH
jgi:hypothetical protein